MAIVTYLIPRWVLACEDAQTCYAVQRVGVRAVSARQTLRLATIVRESRLRALLTRLEVP